LANLIYDLATTKLVPRCGNIGVRGSTHPISRIGGPLTGTIRTLRVDKGFGFIKDDTGKDFFFHQSAIYGEGIDNLREGDRVEFDVGAGPKGPRAENVRRTST
jgi:CspA family cold shock protein